MKVAPPLKRIPVGIVVDRSKAASPWVDFVWRPITALAGVPATAPWTVLSEDAHTTRFYAGCADIELHRSEAENYRENLATGAPLLWVALRPTEGEPPFAIAAVTADPAEGEAFTEAGSDLVDSVPMPHPIEEEVARFVAEHHVQRDFVKRKRDRADQEALARRTKASGDGD